MTSSEESIDALMDRLVAEYSDRAAGGDPPAHDAFLDLVPDPHRAELDRCLTMIDRGLGETEVASVPLGPGVVLGGFEIRDSLGRGGMAVVHRALQVDLGRRVALKILRPSLAVDRRHIDRFHREAQAIARLNHPNVVQVFAVGEDQGHHFIAMEEVTGPSLAEVLRRLPRGARTARDLANAAGIPELVRPGESFEQAICRLLGAVLAGVAAAHAVGVIHRDLKPSNILIRDDGRPVVADFGLAKADGDLASTRTGAPLGTPFYMSPEQVELASVRVDARTDVYSVGVTLYEALAGRRPFSGETALAVYEAIRHGNAPSLRSVASDVTPSAEAVVERALSRDPDARYPSAEAMATELALLSEGRTTAAFEARGGPTRRFFRTVRRLTCGRPFEYRSRAAPLGLPLVHVRTGDPRGPAARGWLAIGSKAFGLVAVGPIAVGAIAVGALGIGLFAVGAGIAVGGFALSAGVGVGGVATGGVAVGGAAIGGLAVGRVAIGGHTVGPAGISGSRRDADAVDWFTRHTPFTFDAFRSPDRGAAGRAVPATHSSVSDPSVSDPSKESDMLKEAALAVSTLAALTPPDAVPGGVTWAHRTLSNGVRVALAEIPDAPMQSCFTLLPLGLLNDAKDEAQFAHLVEHMMIRSTDPDGLEVDGIRLNGETTGLALRLESIAPPDQWRPALDRHAKWLAAADVDEVVLAREKTRITGEEEQTTQHGYTGKWALAAWNQIVRHGKSHAAIHGDVAGTTPADVKRVLAERVPIGDEVLVVSVGPVAIDLVVAALEESIGALEARPVTAPTSSWDGDSADHDATWDLDAWHYAEWYPVPDETPEDRIAAALLARVLSMRLMSDPALKGRSLSVMATDELVTDRGRFLLLSGGGRGRDDLDAIRSAIEEVVADPAEAPAGVPSLEYLAEQLLAQMTAWPDLRLIRRQMAGRPGTEFLEAQVVLTRTMFRLTCGFADDETFGSAAAAFDSSRVASLAEEVFAETRRGTLVLRPVE